MTAVTRVGRVEARIVQHRWDWAERNASGIAEHWARRKAARPAIFNGRVLMVAETQIEADTLQALFFETDYANLLTWLDWGAPDRSVQNGFAMGALSGSDGAFLLGVMGAHTSQAGRVYFPAGTPDPTDIRPDGAVDLVSSITREIEEETGFTPAEYEVEPDWVVVTLDGYAAFMREVRLPWPAAEARETILRHLATEAQPELADIRLARSLADIDETAMPTYLQAFLRWSFSGATGRSSDQR